MSPARRRSVMIGLVIGLVVAVPLAFALSNRNDSVDRIDLNAPETNTLPTNPVTDLTGKKLTLADLHDDKVMVVNFWQKSCAPCRKEMPAFEQVHQEYGDKVRFVGVDGGDELEVVQEFIAEVKVTYDIVRDPAFDLATAMGVRVYPATFLIDRDGAVVSATYGEMDVAQLRSLIDEQLAIA
ncbi:MAG: TlpA family protein disulfide reductase [Acidimicrobiia bacterium]